MSEIEEIKQKIDIVDLVSEYTELKKSGKSYKGLCPFHNEKTPSFYVSPDKNMCWCFACQKGGDVFKFLQEIENIEFVEALKILAEKAGVEIKKISHTQKSVRDKLLECIKEAESFFASKLKTSDSVKKYLAERDLNEKTVQEFALGYAPKGKNNLLSFLKTKGFSQEEISKAGLVKIRDMRQGVAEDKFFDRLMIPLQDTMGRTVGFTARALDEKNIPKYLNSPETPIFKKKEIIFAFHMAKESARQEQEFLLMEGNLDVVSSFQHGIRHAVAVSGTAFSAGQAKKIQRVAPKLKIIFDADPAGIKASTMAIVEGIKAGLEVEVVNISEGKDPDEALRNNKKKFLEDIANSKSAFDFLWDQFSAEEDQSTAQGKRKIAEKMSGFLSANPSEIEKNFYLEKLAEKLKIPAEVIKKELNRKREIRQKKEVEIKKEKVGKIEHIFALLAAFPEDFDENDFDGLEIFCQTKLQKELYNFLKKTYHLKDRGAEITEKEDVQLTERVGFLALLAEKKYGNISPQSRRKEVKNLYGRLLRGRSDQDDFQKTWDNFKEKFLS